MAAGYGAAVMLLIMSRAPVPERVVGADKLARWHAFAGPVVSRLGRGSCGHGLGGLGDCPRGRPVGGVAGWRSWPGLVTATLGTGLLLVIGIASMRWFVVGCRISCGMFHLLGYLAVGLGFTHQLAAGTGAGWSALAADRLSLLYTYTFAVVLLLPRGAATAPAVAAPATCRTSRS